MRLSEALARWLDRRKPTTHISCDITDCDRCAERGIQPDTQYVLVHNRMTDTLHFGPFATPEEAWAWADEHPGVRGGVIPITKTVDWNSRGGWPVENA